MKKPTILIIALVVIVVAVAGFKLATKNDAGTANDNSTDPVAHVAPAINSASDIDNAISALNQNDPLATNDDDITALKNQTDALQ